MDLFHSEPNKYINIDKLEDFVKSYNHSVHRMIGMRPSEVREEDQDRVWARLFGKNLHRPRKPSVVGKISRISKIKGLFEKLYMPNWSEEHFHIKSRIPKKGNRFSNWETTWAII